MGHKLINSNIQCVTNICNRWNEYLRGNARCYKWKISIYDSGKCIKQYGYHILEKFNADNKYGMFYFQYDLMSQQKVRDISTYTHVSKSVTLFSIVTRLNGKMVVVTFCLELILLIFMGFLRQKEHIWAYKCNQQIPKCHLFLDRIRVW